ncbi:hypothetical protein [Mesonia aquimarina]|uniref:hypothetical protein n=1 Tax=Mesonia aquimarina TaxID=1504967 RepID=UPI000EF5783D|nr:hypothetical protein [Mesonia aquimarina]
MIEVFTTTIPTPKKARIVIKKLKTEFPDSKIHVDIEEEIKNYPCTHSILRFEGKYTSSNSIRQVVLKEGYQCDVLEDKVCHS